MPLSYLPPEKVVMRQFLIVSWVMVRLSVSPPPTVQLQTIKRLRCSITSVPQDQGVPQLMSQSSGFFCLGVILSVCETKAHEELVLWATLAFTVCVRNNLSKSKKDSLFLYQAKFLTLL